MTLVGKELKADKTLYYSKTCLKRPLKKNTKIGFQYRILLNAGQKNCRMLQGEHTAILSTFIKLPFSINTFVLSILSGHLRQVLLYSLLLLCFEVRVLSWNLGECYIY